MHRMSISAQQMEEAAYVKGLATEASTPPPLTAMPAWAALVEIKKRVSHGLHLGKSS